MKLIFAIVNGEDAAAVSTELTRAGYIVTKLATKGGFLKTGNTTFLIGVEEEKVEDVIGIIREYSSKRTQMVPDLSAFPGDTLALPLEVTVGGATIFVTDVDRFEKF